MKKSNSTKKALLLSIVSLCLCIAMLAGTTFAWFTETIKSENNIITAGNLDIELYWSVDAKNWTKVDENTNIFKANTLWEPGHTEVVYLKVVNEGTLALKYQLGVNIAEEIEGVNQAGNPFKLSDYIKFGVDEIDQAISYGTRQEALAAVKDSLKIISAGYSKSSKLYPKNNVDNFATQEYVALVVTMPENVSNDANHNGTDIPSIRLGINLFATQLTYEKDSYNEKYDAGAPWTGEVDTTWYNTIDTEFTLTTAAQLAGLAEIVNDGTDTFKGKTVKLGADIDLNNVPWTAIGDCEGSKSFRGTFDGQEYTIYNLYVDYSADTSEYATAGLFGWVDYNMATVKNVKVDGAIVKGSHWVGVIAGYFTGRIENCSVNNATVDAYNLNDDANGDKVGGIVGCLNEHSYLNNNTVTNSTISGNRDIGGIAGSVALSTIEMNNNKVSDTVITYSTVKSYACAGAIVSGRTGYVANDTNVATNVTINSSVTVSNADDLAKVLTGTEKNITVVLSENIDLPISSLGQQTGGSGEYKVGGENTEKITIDLNGKKLNITTTYQSAIGAENDDATITIKNGSMTSTGNNSTTWNIYDIEFCNCNYVIQDVTFDKAVALDNAGKSTIMKKVTINETHDYYALWITAEGQEIEINGLTIDSEGRGIKIDEQYVSTPAKVTLNVSNATFNTAKKAAIMVKSAAGAEITLSNVDIAGVAQDTVNTVWVDEDAAAYADLVNVTGGTKVNEADVVTDGLYKNGNTYYIKNANGLKWLSGKYMVANNGTAETATFELMADIDLGGEDFKEFGVAYGDTINFNGNNHTISNFKLATGEHNGMTNVGMFYVDTGATLNVSDLNLVNPVFADGVDEYTTGVAVVVGYANGTVNLNNVDVTGASVNNTYGNAAIYVGYCVNKVTLTDCDVTNSTASGEVEDGVVRADKTGAFGATVNTNTCKFALNNCTNDTALSDVGRVINGATLFINGAAQKSAASQTELNNAVASGSKVDVTLS